MTASDWLIWQDGFKYGMAFGMLVMFGVLAIVVWDLGRRKRG